MTDPIRLAYLYPQHLKLRRDPPKWIIPLVLIIVILICIGLAWATEIDLSIIARIESGNNPYAYNHITGAAGLYQITKICYQDYLNHFGKKGTSGFVPRCMSDLYDIRLNKKVAIWYLTKRIPQLLRYYHKPITIENLLWAYNSGIGNLVKGIKPKETVNYIKKYQKLAKQ